MSDTTCDPEVFNYGESVYMTSTVSTTFLNKWVKKIAKKSGQKVDWSWVGGRAIVQFIGDKQKVVDAIQSVYGELRDEMYAIFKRDGLEDMFSDGHVGKYL